MGLTILLDVSSHLLYLYGHFFLALLSGKLHSYLHYYYLEVLSFTYLPV